MTLPADLLIEAMHLPDEANNEYSVEVKSIEDGKGSELSTVLQKGEENVRLCGIEGKEDNSNREIILRIKEDLKDSKVPCHSSVPANLLRRERKVSELDHVIGLKWGQRDKHENFNGNGANHREEQQSIAMVPSSPSKNTSQISQVSSVKNLHVTLQDRPSPYKLQIARRIADFFLYDRNSFAKLLPILGWISNYDVTNNLAVDILIGITVGIVHCAQGLSIAPISNLASVVGLYMGVFPGVIYMIFGTSRHAAYGVTQQFIYMAGIMIEKYSLSDEELNKGIIGYSKMEVTVTITFTIGIWLLLLGIFQVGSICNFLTPTIMSAFNSAIAFHIAAIQLKVIFGIQVEEQRGPLKFVYLLVELVPKISETNFVTLALSIMVFIVFYVCVTSVRNCISQKTKFPVPFGIFVISAGVLVSYFLDLKGKYGVSVVGDFPLGLPYPMMPCFDLIPEIVFECFVIAVIQSLSSISLVSWFAKKDPYEIDCVQELRAYGLATIVASFFQCLPPSCSYRRTALVYSAGTKTQLTHGVSALTVLFMLVFFGTYFGEAPKCVFAAIGLVLLRNLLLEGMELPKIWRQNKLEGAIWVIIWLTTLLTDFSWGIAIGFVLSMIVSLYLTGIRAGVLPIRLYTAKKAIDVPM